MSDFILVKTERDNDQVRRVLRLDPIERLFRKSHIDDDMYRVARCMEADLRVIEGVGGGGGLARAGEAFVAIARSASPTKRADAPLEAAQRLQATKSRIGADVAFLVLCDLLQGYTPSELDDRWFRKRNKGTARATVIMALERAIDCDAYATQRHKVQIWAEAAA